MEQINCLRCRHCKLLPDTNMGDVSPVVWCEKMQDRMPLNLSGCGVADPRQYHCNAKNSRRVAALVGDKYKHIHEVETAWLKVHLPRTPWRKITAATGRDKETLKNWGRKRGISRELVEYNPSRPVNAKRRRGLIFTAEQAAYIEECYYSGYWPAYGDNFRPETRQRAREIRETITERVNEMNVGRREPWTWVSICAHMKWKQPAYLRDMSAENKRKRDARKLRAQQA